MTHNGNIISTTEIEEQSLRSTEVEYWTFEALFGFLEKVLSNPIVSTHLGLIMNGNAGETVCEDKIYVSPTDFPYDLITEDINETIALWNADDLPHYILNITIFQSAGITLDAPPTPYFLTPETDLKFGLQILKEGPAVQNSRIVITMDSIVFEITITGKRMVSFNFLCDWREPPKIKYGYQTIIFRNLYFQEQRRPLLVNPIRSMEAAFTFKKQEVEKFVNEVRNLSKKVIGIPVYTESMTSSVNLQGYTILLMNENLSNYFNLNNFTILILLLSKSNKYKAELKSIVTVGSSNIIVDQAVIGSFPPEDTIIFPVMIGIIESKNFVEETAMLITANLQFKEIRPDVG